MNKSEFSVDTRSYGNARVLIIAEIGTGHGGDEIKATELISAAIESGADCVKFQHVYADEIIHRATGLVPLPGGLTPLYDTFKALETGPEFMARLKDRVESLGALFLCTPFGPKSARELRDIGVRAMKIASPELNYAQLIDELAEYGLPTILSSGVSRLCDIENALKPFSHTGIPIALLHCVTAYPAPEADYNLRMLEALSTLFGLPVGVSDHSADPLVVPSLAVASGACIIEKHICLSRSHDGLDDPIALPPGDFFRMATAVRRTSRLVGEIGVTAAINALKNEYGAARVEAVLGDGCKRLAPSEASNYMRTNRSIHARRPIARGNLFSEDNLAILRTEKVLRPGLEPRCLPVVLGRHAARDIPDGEGVEWADLGDF
ncbi:MAG: spore coat protein [Spirochaetes bacterium GWB1_59_5]|nr:MAG: spore coat protein [Spirochaetes bacterium GWB1_59_5]